MDSSCAKCGAHLDSPWKFCPGCGNAVASAHAVPREHEPAPVKAAFSGLLLGAVVAPILLIVGSLLCLTGLGAFLGVPMIICGILAPLAGPVIGIDSLKGACPWCGAAVTSVNSQQSFDCDSCKQRIAIKNHKFVSAV